MTRIDKKIIRKLKRTLGREDVLTDAADIFVHSYDATDITRTPGVIARPRTIEKLVETLGYLWDEEIPTVIRGAGTGFSGGALAGPDCALIITDRLKNIGSIEGDTIWVEPGVVVDQLNDELRPDGLFYPVDPASSEVSTIGGNVAENSGGPRALKYGVTRDNVVELDILSPARGRGIMTGESYARDYLGTIIGSEGTLAVTLRARLRLYRWPKRRSAVLATFGDSSTAGGGAVALLSSGLLPAKLEFIDRLCIECSLNKDPGCLPEDAGAVLLIEFDGPPDVVADESEKAAGILEDNGASSAQTATGEAGIERLWLVRKGLSPALGQLAPHKLNEDVAVPRSRIPRLLRIIGDISHDNRLPIPVFGHIGDGNLHVNVMFDRTDADQKQRAEKTVNRIMESTIELGGTITGEHGVGLSKMPFLSLEQSPAEFALAAEIKAEFDPDGLLNPGKIFTKEVQPFN
ncbi:MAG: FAD-binding protein [bacterium]|nr:FAD-binding protein [bacterium]